MKATGIVRRIDDLGRVVIPKEIRRTMRIREGDPLEIYTDREGEVIFKKYSPIGELTNFASQYAETLNKEYTRDKKAGINPKIPEHYFPNDDDTQPPVISWRAHATLLFTNWLNYFVYQATPYDISEIKESDR